MSLKFRFLDIGTIFKYLALAIAILSIPTACFVWVIYTKRKSEGKKSTAAKAAGAFGAASIESTASDASSIADLEESSDAKKID